ncbi:hypothetical protein SPSIL_015240 [Sporomusa silvacetica DSM 10669]|uniref:Uncharacterized protein n=1 Tax=Sporomusa silvacetica DSM 10669 TaxID=1123289 RepID=A0ABZ3IJ21_9FIRM|nr:hypothetical protein [Sporomusa silvacetica]OZC21586.1 hypothetical protein SPSIL_09970 [Sporomusa silvacetica DSM 10669]
MTLQQWITKYEKEAEKFILLPGFVIYYEPEHGFFCWKVTGNSFEIDHTCTDNIHWAHNKCMKMAKERGCKLLRTATTHDPAAYMRLTKGTPNIALSSVKPNGKMYWIFEQKVQ